MNQQKICLHPIKAAYSVTDACGKHLDKLYRNPLKFTVEN